MSWKIHWLVRYGLAVAAVGAACGVRLALTPLVGPGLPAYVTFYPAVMVAALLGFGPGVLATLFSALTAAFWLLPPAGLAVGTLADAVGLALFSGMGVFMSVVAELYRRAHDQTTAPAGPTKAVGRSAARRPLVGQGLLLNLGLVAAVTVLAFGGWRAFRDVGATSEAIKRETRAHLTLQQLEWLSTAMKQVELAQHAFVLTGDESYLEPYRDSLARVMTNLSSVGQLTRDDPRQQEHLAALEPLLREKFTEVEQTIQTRRHQGLVAALGLLTTPASQRRMATIDQRLALAQQEEQGMLQVQTTAEVYSTDATLKLILAGGVVSLLLLAAVFLFLKQENGRRLRAEAALLRHQDQLQEEVSARTSDLSRANEQLKREIQDHQQSREALQLSQRRLAAIVDSIVDGFYAVDRQFRVTHINAAALRYFGKTREQMLGQNLFELFPAIRDSAFGAEFRHAFESGNPVHLEAPSVVTAQIVEVHAYPGPDNMTILFRDVTRQRQMAEDLRRNEALLRAITDHSPDPIFLKDRQGRMLLANPATLATIGKPGEAVLGKVDAEFYDEPEVGRALMATDQRIMAAGRTEVVEETLPTPDGPRTFLCTKSPYRDPHGNIIGLVGIARDISDRKQAQEELQRINLNLEQLVAGRTAELRATARYARSLLEASLDPVVTISPEGQITDVNPATELVTGVARERLIGSDFSSYFTVPEEARRGYRQVLAEGLIRDYPLTIRHASGRTVDVLYHATVYRNEAGQVQGVFAAARDITERKRMGSVLRESEARYRSLVTASAQIVWTTNALGEVTLEMPTWQAFTGQTFEEYRGLGWSDAIHPEDRQNIITLWSRAVATRGLYQTEYRLRARDGQYRYVAARGVSVPDAQGEIQEWVGTCTDVTESREAERRREFTNALLGLFAHTGSLKEYLAAVVEVVRQWSGCQALGIRILDDKQELPYAACAGFEPEFFEVENALSLERDDCCCIRVLSQAFESQDQGLLTPGGSYRCDNLPAFIGQLPPQKQARYRNNCLQFGFVSVGVVPIRYRQQPIGALHLADRRAGHFPFAAIEFLESMTPLVGEAIHRFQAEAELTKYRDHLEELVKQRTVELVVANTRLESEIAERKRTEETLHQTAQELERSNRDLEQFAYVASHDLQEPLRAVGGYVKLLQLRFPQVLDAKAIEFINGAADGAGRMERLITDLLAFARVGTRGASFAPMDLAPLLREVLENLQPAIQTAQARITTDPLPTLTVDATQMVQLFQNLIANALKFRGEGRPPRIHVGAAKQEGQWVLSVRDNGIGIDAQYFERIFQIFQRLHTRKYYPGTGIGLAICKKIVERHGGRIWVESQPGQGSTFSFALPEISVIREPQYD